MLTLFSKRRVTSAGPRLRIFRPSGKPEKLHAAYEPFTYRLVRR